MRDDLRPKKKKADSGRTLNRMLAASVGTVSVGKKKHKDREPASGSVLKPHRPRLMAARAVPARLKGVTGMSQARGVQGKARCSKLPAAPRFSLSDGLSVLKAGDSRIAIESVDAISRESPGDSPQGGKAMVDQGSSEVDSQKVKGEGIGKATHSVWASRHIAFPLGANSGSNLSTRHSPSWPRTGPVGPARASRIARVHTQMLFHFLPPDPSAPLIRILRPISACWCWGCWLS